MLEIKASTRFRSFSKRPSEIWNILSQEETAAAEEKKSKKEAEKAAKVNSLLIIFYKNVLYI